MRFEIEVQLGAHIFKYSIAFEFPQGFKELRVFEESLSSDSRPVFTRKLAQAQLATSTKDEAKFLIDWHLAALPIIQERAAKDPLFVFKQWLARALILRPDPLA